MMWIRTRKWLNVKEAIDEISVNLEGNNIFAPKQITNTPKISISHANFMAYTNDRKKSFRWSNFDYNLRLVLSS